VLSVSSLFGFKIAEKYKQDPKKMSLKKFKMGMQNFTHSAKLLQKMLKTSFKKVRNHGK